MMGQRMSALVALVSDCTALRECRAFAPTQQAACRAQRGMLQVTVPAACTRVARRRPRILRAVASRHCAVFKAAARVVQERAAETQLMRMIIVPIRCTATSIALQHGLAY
eukprot:scpid61123/ scgid35539/ 